MFILWCHSSNSCWCLAFKGEICANLVAVFFHSLANCILHRDCIVGLFGGGWLLVGYCWAVVGPSEQSELLSNATLISL